MEENYIIIYIICSVIIYAICKLFNIPLKKIIALIINSILGGILIFIINIIGKSFFFHIGLNIWTSIFIGIFGIPGAALLVILKLIL